MYEFPLPDSDFDLRGVQMHPLREVVGLYTGQETVEKSGIRDGLEIDLVTQDARKFFGLLLKKKVAGADKGRMDQADLGFLQWEYERLRAGGSEAGLSGKHTTGGTAGVTGPA